MGTPWWISCILTWSVFFFNRLVYVSLELDISQGVFQKISTRQNKSQKVVCSQENIQSGLSSKEDA